MRACYNRPVRKRLVRALVRVATPVLALCAGCGGRSDTTATSTNTSASPDGRYVLVTTAHHRHTSLSKDNYIRIEIRNRKGRVEHDEKISWAGQARWYTRWDKSDRVWLDNPDMGIFYWERDGESRWQRHAYEQDKSPEPPFVLSRAGG